MQFIQTYVSTCFYISPKRTSRGFGELPCRQQLIGLGRNKWIDSIQVVILQKHRSFTAKRERKGAPIGQFSTQYCCIYSPYYIWKHAVFRHSWGLVSCLRRIFRGVTGMGSLPDQHHQKVGRGFNRRYTYRPCSRRVAS